MCFVYVYVFNEEFFSLITEKLVFSQQIEYDTQEKKKKKKKKRITTGKIWDLVLVLVLVLLVLIFRFSSS